MSLSRAGRARLQREFLQLQKDPPPGIQASPNDAATSTSTTTTTKTLVEPPDPTQLTDWTATIKGPRDSPFEGVPFQVTVHFGSRYPIDPPTCQFASPLIPYHPNIDSQGRICLDTLKRPPAGSWSPAVSLSSLLLSLQILLGEPNADDGLQADATRLYHLSRDDWHKEAKRRIQKQQKEQTQRKRSNENSEQPSPPSDDDGAQSKRQKAV